MIPPRIHFSGPETECNRLLRFAREQLRLLVSQSLNGEKVLDQRIKRINSALGWSVVVRQVGALSDIYITVPEGVTVNPRIEEPLVIECWCCCCFAEAEVVAVYGTYGCVSSCANDIPYPVCFNRSPLLVQNYAGIRYKVKVCQKTTEKTFIALASDMAEYEVGDKVVVYFRGHWTGSTKTDFTVCKCTAGGSCVDQACEGSYPPSGDRATWKKPDGVYVIVPFRVEDVNDIIRKTGIDFTTIDITRDLAEEARVRYAKINTISWQSNTADIDIYHYDTGTTESVSGVPIHYNCEDHEIFSRGHHAFIENQYDTDPQIKTSFCIVLSNGGERKIVGFMDGLPRRCYSCSADRTIYMNSGAVQPGVGEASLEIIGGKAPYTWEVYCDQGHYNPFSFPVPESDTRFNTMKIDVQDFSEGAMPLAEVWVYDACFELKKCYVTVGCEGVDASITLMESVWSSTKGMWIDTYEASDKRAYLWSITGANFDDGSFFGTGEDLSTDHVEVRRPLCGQYTLYLRCFDSKGKHNIDTFTSPEYTPDSYIVTDTYQMYFSSNTLISSSDNALYKWKIDGAGAFSQDLTVKELTGFNWVRVYAPGNNTASCSGNSNIQMICVAKDGKETVVDSIRMAFTSDTTYLAYWKYHHDVCGGNAIDATCDCSTDVNSFKTGTVYYYGYDCANRLMTTYYTGTGTKCPAGCTNVIACSTTAGGCSNPKETFCTTTYLQICVNMLASCYTNPWDKRAILSEAQKAQCCPAGLGL